MGREYAIELLKRMKRRAMTDDYETTWRVADWIIPGETEVEDG